MPDKDLRTVTNGERLWIERRKLGRTQAERAERYGVCERIYSEVERDLRDDIKARRPTDCLIGVVCALARRRHGQPLLEVAARFGCSHVELLRRERDSDPRLVEAWRALGYVF